MIIKPIQGWNGYFVTDTGKVLSTKSKQKQVVINPSLWKGSYPRVCLCNGKVEKNLYVYRLVLSAFVETKPPYARAIHKDNNKHNNEISNLMWADHGKKDRPPVEHERLVKIFHRGYIPSAKTGCWNWKTYSAEMYGNLKINGKTKKAHRISWTLHYGDIPDGMWVLHRCDNPRCVNPHHLFLGTAKDNTADRIAKGRYVGEQKARAKLTNQDVAEIKQVHPYFTQKALAEIYGVSHYTIQDILYGKTWSYIG